MIQLNWIPLIPKYSPSFRHYISFLLSSFDRAIVSSGGCVPDVTLSSLKWSRWWNHSCSQHKKGLLAPLIFVGTRRFGICVALFDPDLFRCWVSLNETAATDQLYIYIYWRCHPSHIVRNKFMFIFTHIPSEKLWQNWMFLFVFVILLKIDWCIQSILILSCWFCGFDGKHAAAL